MKYTATLEWTVTADVEVEADSVEDAIEKAKELPLPEKGEYMDGTFNVLAIDGEFVI